MARDWTEEHYKDDKPMTPAKTPTQVALEEFPANRNDLHSQREIYVWFQIHEETIRAALSPAALPDIEKDPLGHHLESLRLLGYPVTLFAEFPKKEPAPHHKCPDGLECSGDGWDCVGDGLCKPQDLEALKREGTQYAITVCENDGIYRIEKLFHDFIDHLAATGRIRGV